MRSGTLWWQEGMKGALLFRESMMDTADSGMTSMNQKTANRTLKKNHLQKQSSNTPMQAVYGCNIYVRLHSIVQVVLCGMWTHLPQMIASGIYTINSIALHKQFVVHACTVLVHMHFCCTTTLFAH